MAKAAKAANDKSAQLGIEVEKDKQFGKWYTQVVLRASLIEYYDISGCYILRPNAYAVWEAIQSFLDGQIKASGVKNCYFPLLVSEAALTKEESHLEGFSPEVAWVTRAGHSELGNPVAIRPTSETIMYPIFSKWISSHRDLPLRINQWTNIVRWEFKDAVPFIRSREFLWQEGHSAFATKEEADKEVLEILDYYRRAYEEVLAVPVTPGKKSEKEKFAGADYTTTIEAFIPTNGRGVQAATSHCLGQTFSCEKMFNISFNDDSGSTKYVYQNSWGFTTRSIGVMIMTHGDNKGLVLPPRVAPTQVVIIPIHFKNKIDIVNDKCAALLASLKKAGIRAEFDNRPYNPGWKHNDHELHGVPLRIEIGPRDVQNNTCVVCRRDKPNKEDKLSLQIGDNFDQTIADLLEQLQADLFARAKALRDAQTRQITQWSDFVPTLNEKNVILAPWCEKPECEDEIKKKSKAESESLTSDDEVGHQLTGAAKSLCIPFNQPELPVGTKCFCCGGEPKSWTLFGRSY